MLFIPTLTTVHIQPSTFNWMHGGDIIATGHSENLRDIHCRLSSNCMFCLISQRLVDQIDGIFIFSCGFNWTSDWNTMSEPSSKDTVMKTAMIYVCGGEYTIFYCDFRFGELRHMWKPHQCICDIVCLCLFEATAPFTRSLSSFHFWHQFFVWFDANFNWIVPFISNFRMSLWKRDAAKRCHSVPRMWVSDYVQKAHQEM